MLVPRPTGSSAFRPPEASRWTPPRADLSFAVGFVAGVPATVLAWLCGAGQDTRIGLIVVALTAAAVGAASAALGALAAALPLWALDTGFVINRLGTLSLDHRTIPALATMILAAEASCVLAGWARRLNLWRTRRRTRPQ